ncbi:dipeptide epimerase [Sunxiuqinia dokdonensis]|nr:dipeptide epimerase [Sunxiuqinia dokdonensis]
MNKKGLTLRFKPYELMLNHAFTLAASSRTTTPVMLIELEYDGLIGYGEASLPPYLGESAETVARFLSRLQLNQFNPIHLEKILDYVDGVAPGNCAAKASVDIALHDLLGKMMNTPWHSVWKYDPAKAPSTSFTIGLDNIAVVRQKVKEAAAYKILKVKLGRDNDREMIETIRSMTDVPLCVDVNQGWSDRKQALDLIFWLKEQGVVFVEQPMPKTAVDDMAWLTQHSPLPTIADEALQRLDDVKKVHGVYSGINIKLMKCTGLYEAHKMLSLAKALDLKVMVGCMTETSCAISAAAQLSPAADWADLDGNLLIANDPFEGVQVIDGKIVLNNHPGIGVKPRC